MSWKTLATGLITIALCLAPFGAAQAQEKVVWAKGKVKVKGDAYDDELHAGTENLSVTCFFRLGLLEPDFDEATLLHYCKLANGDFELANGDFELLPLPGRNYLAAGTFEATDGASKSLEVEGYFRVLVDRKKSGAPKALTIKRRAAIGTAELGDDEPEVVGKGDLKATSVGVSDVPEAPRRSKLMACGTFTRDIATLIPEGSPLSLVSGCIPNRETQALLVQRRASEDLPEDLSDYLEAGGIVITEFNNADEVFNLVFPETVEQAEGLLGDCFDNVQPQVQLSSDDPFWAAFAFESVGNESGCGPSLEAFPGVQKLGGWSEQDQSVSLAYRELGAGRVWFLSSDWQDTEPLTDTSLQMFDYMMKNR